MLCKNILLAFCVWGILLGSSVYAEDEKPSLDKEAKHVSLSGYAEDGAKSWDLTAQTAEFVNSKQVNLEKPEGVLYRSNNPEMNLRSDAGKYYPREGNVHLDGNVVVKDSSGAVLKTSELNWDAQKAVLQADQKINLQMESAQLTGSQMKIFKNDGTADLRENVKLKVKNEDPSRHPSIITSQGPMKVNYKENYVEFFDNVVVIDTEMTLKAEYMKVEFNPDHSLKHVYCKGSVLIVHQDKKATSEEAEYDALAKTVILTKDPKILNQGNLLTADTITFSLQDEKVSCTPSAQLILMPSEKDKAIFNFN